MKKYEIINSEKILSGLIFDVYRDTINFHNQKTAKRDIIRHQGAVGILAINDQNEVIIVKQYRHPAKKEVIEIPAGLVNKDEKPIDTAKRELEEETGLIANHLEYMTSIYGTIGICDEIIELYFTNDLSQGKTNLDDDEFIEVLQIDLNELVKMIESTEIVDAKTIVSVLYYLNFIQK